MMKKTGSGERAHEVSLKNGDSLVRLGVLAQLYQSRPEDLPGPSPVAACLMDTNPAVQQLAVATLKKLGVSGIPALIQALDNTRETALRQAAASALAGLGIESAPAIPALCACLESDDDHLRWHAGYALSQIGPPAIPALQETLKSSDHAVLVSTLTSLEWMGNKANNAITNIQTFADHSEPLVRIQCYAALIKVSGDPSTGLPKLFSLLDKEPDPTLRAAYIEKIGLLGNDARDGKEMILKYFTDSSSVVRAAAAIALARTGCDFSSSETEWLTLLKDSDQEVRSNAVIAIASYGSEASAAVPCLEKMILQEPSDLAALATAALTKIIGDPL